MKKLLLLLTISCISSSVLAQDWANLERFKKENSTIMQEQKKAQRVVFI
jgi:hypothetical protein